MIRLTPTSTRTATLFPYPTLFRSEVAAMSDADKQEAAVVMAYKAIAAAHRAGELRSANDRSGLERLRRAIRDSVARGQGVDLARSEEHTSELQSLMRISYAVFCLQKKKNNEVRVV